MTFKTKIFSIIFIVGLIPSISLLVISAILLNSALTRIGASGLESSIEAALSMVSTAESTIGEILSSALGDDIPWRNAQGLDNWRNSKKLDIAYGVSDNTRAVSLSDTLRSLNFDTGEIPSKTGLSHWRQNDVTVLIYSKEDAGEIIGCGVLMPREFTRTGMILSEALAASASLSMYRKFSLSLLSVVTLITLFLITAAGYFLSKVISVQLVKPLEKLSAGAFILGSGDLGHRVEIESGDEFGRLAGSFNRMASEIAENQKKLIETEKLAAWREVARRIAHEIKNPLTPIGVEIYRLQDMAGKTARGGDDKAAEALRAIDTQINVLRDLANQFSAFAKEPDLKTVECSVADLIHQAVELYKGYENCTIDTRIEEDLPVLNLDPRMMVRVFGNIIKNSCEASPDLSNITIDAASRKDGVMIRFKDNGPGFPSAKLENIAAPYFTTKKSGTGLGLAIIKKIIEEHKGEIRIYNDDGAVVEIYLPTGR